MRRFPLAAFVTLAVVTIAAFFVTQHLKVSTPVLNGYPAPHPAAINPIDGRVCKGTSHRSSTVSFYLQNRSDDVDVYIVDRNGTIIDTLASGAHMVAGRHPVRRGFTWNGRTSSGLIAPDGTYYIRVSLIHQGRSVLISSSSGPLPVIVKTVPPHPRVTGVAPELVPRVGVAKATIHYTGTQGLAGTVVVLRTDVPGAPRVVKRFRASGVGSSVWDGTVTGGQPAPQGTYLIGLRVTDQACNPGSFPAQNPPVAGTTPHAGVTVRYLAALPPLRPVAPGASATVYVDARQHRYAWALRAAGTQRVLRAGSSAAVPLRVPMPGSSTGTGLYQLALRYGAHRTLVPVTGSPLRAARARVLVVLPALSWQGLNPVDDDADGIPNTLDAGYPVLLARPLVNGLPAGWGEQLALLNYLTRNHLAYALTTDLALLYGTGPRLAGYAGVLLAGDERWVPPALAAALRTYVGAGGHLLSLGIDSLRQGVSLAGGRAYDPTAPQAADVLGARVGPLTPTRGLVLAGRDQLGLFRGTSGAFRGFASFQAFTGVTPPLRIASMAGPTTEASAIIGFRRGRGLVVDLGLSGFAARLARSADAREILGRIWTVLSR